MKLHFRYMDPLPQPARRTLREVSRPNKVLVRGVHPIFESVTVTSLFLNACCMRVVRFPNADRALSDVCAWVVRVSREYCEVS
jgi:hypothetical protein